MEKFPLPRLDKDDTLRNFLIPYCRLKKGEIWRDEISGHCVGCLDAASEEDVKKLTGGREITVAVHDPPYNMIAFGESEASDFVKWSRRWVDITYDVLTENGACYIWLGADQKNHLQPFAEFVLMMKETGFSSRSFITMRNQRGYGTQKNWMAVRQELLYYVKGNPVFNTEFVYTDIPKVLKGYYKDIGGVKKENLERSRSANIRAGNVWIDIQQVFHLMEENTAGCYAQKPLKALERILNVSSSPGDAVLDLFAHSGATLLAAEITGRTGITADIDPVFCEISIRRVENFRKYGATGWQRSNPFAAELKNNREALDYLKDKYNITIEIQEKLL